MTVDYTGPDRRQSVATALPWWVLPALAGVVLLVFAAVAAASFMTNDATLRTQTANTWSNLAIAVVAYWYGSSAGSSKKDDALAATSMKQNETIADQGKALAASAPVAISAAIDPGQPVTATTTAPPKVETPLP